MNTTEDNLHAPGPPHPVSVAGGYWTRSSALVDLLAEHRHCSMVPGEFSLFSFGQLFQQVTHPLLEGEPVGAAFQGNLLRMSTFNQAERLPRVSGMERRLCRLLGLYPPPPGGSAAGRAWDEVSARLPQYPLGRGTRTLRASAYP